MIDRQITPFIQESANTYPMVAIIGPRQSGKTTLAKSAFPDYNYVNLESPDKRTFASEDPRSFLQTYANKTIIDEIQRVPELFSYLQVISDEAKLKGQYILTGSQHFLMMKSVSQSLAGRIALHTLWPLAYPELKDANLNSDHYIDHIYHGGYPRVYESGTITSQWLGDYVQTYLDRDLRLLSQVGDLMIFERFIKLCAGRTGQILNIDALASDSGISHNTAKSWLSILEASFIIYLLPPYYANQNKRLVKSPKLYFIDSGLACWLLGITEKNQLNHHPLMGQLFETFIISEFFKSQLNQGLKTNAYFWRDKVGHEIDLLIEKNQKLTAIEIKSGATIASDYFANLNYFQTMYDKALSKVIYGGLETQKRSAADIYPWFQMNDLFKMI